MKNWGKSRILSILSSTVRSPFSCLSEMTWLCKPSDPAVTWLSSGNDVVRSVAGYCRMCGPRWHCARPSSTSGCSPPPSHRSGGGSHTAKRIAANRLGRGHGAGCGIALGLSAGSTIEAPAGRAKASVKHPTATEVFGVHGPPESSASPSFSGMVFSRIAINDGRSFETMFQRISISTES